jgi:hypothetical protein
MAAETDRRVLCESGSARGSRPRRGSRVSPLGEHRGVRIVSPQALLAELTGEGSPRDDPTVSEGAERLLRRAYEAFNARDIEGSLATMHLSATPSLPR